MDLCCAVEICESQEQRPRRKGADAGVAVCQERAEGNRKVGTASGDKRSRVDGYSEDPKLDSEMVDFGHEEEAVIEKYAGFAKAVATMGLGRAWEMAPLLRVSGCKARARAGFGGL